MPESIVLIFPTPGPELEEKLSLRRSKYVVCIKIKIKKGKFN
jgi:hypothetical protein